MTKGELMNLLVDVPEDQEILVWYYKKAWVDEYLIEGTTPLTNEEWYKLTYKFDKEIEHHWDPEMNTSLRDLATQMGLGMDV